MEVTERRARLMASDVHLIGVGASDAALDDALDHLALLERRWSRFLPDSDVSRINSAHGTPVAVDDVTLVLLSAMVDAWRATAGAYDPTVLHALVEHGYARSIVDPERCTVLDDRAAGTLADLEIEHDAGMVRLPSGLALDPGGIGKGLAADLAVSRLLRQGARGALVGIGGDMAMAGVGPHEGGWSVAVEQPDDTRDVLCTFMVSGGGVATSSTRSRRWWHAGSEQHHLIDPRPRAPARADLASVTVVARTGWEAEAYATAALLAGSAGAIGVLARNRTSGIAVALDGAVTTTDDLREVALHPPRRAG
jgi:thiamine biosynthesis lipoprotein